MMFKEHETHTYRSGFLAICGILAALFLLGACSSSGSAASDTTEPSGTTAAASATTTAESGSKTVKVAIKDFAFNSADIDVAVGTTMEWTNEDSAPHTATSTKAPVSFDSDDLATGKSFSFTFTKPGTYEYYCSIHNYMTGTITVS